MLFLEAKVRSNFTWISPVVCITTQELTLLKSFRFLYDRLWQVSLKFSKEARMQIHISDSFTQSFLKTSTLHLKDYLLLTLAIVNKFFDSLHHVVKLLLMLVGQARVLAIEWLLV